MIKKQPEVITICKLECILMPQGEIIFKGKTIGWFKDAKEYASAYEIAKADYIMKYPSERMMLINEYYAFDSLSQASTDDD